MPGHDTPAGATACIGGAAADRLAERIRLRTQRLLDEAAPLCARHGVDAPRPQIRFDLRGQSAGQAVWRVGGRPRLRFNLGMALRHADDFLAHTVPHEVAHLVTIACFGRVRPHGPEWRAVMRYFGIDDAQRCHLYTVDEASVRRQRRWTYVCACREHRVSTTRHNRMRKEKIRYHCRQCGTALRAVHAAAE